MWLRRYRITLEMKVVIVFSNENIVSWTVYDCPFLSFFRQGAAAFGS